ncbi:hypothetical protein [Bacillus weihaiensis]|uniref:hypothetical protein n=1 Tax=Bacillus weihaiensis TaxID=1547283 RepID=UPI0013142353|nr:hypothetical protein [Bacillus weihaiensis]
MWHKILFLLVMINAISAISNYQSMTTVFAQYKKVISKSEEANVFLYATQLDRKNDM